MSSDEGTVPKERPMSDPKKDAVEYPYPKERDNGTTHWEGCWSTRGHHNCAVAHIATLEAEVERLKAGWNAEHDKWVATENLRLNAEAQLRFYENAEAERTVQMAEARARVAELEAEVAAWKAEMGRQQERGHRWKARVATLEAEVRDLNRQLRRREAEVIDWSAQHVEQTMKLREARARVAEFKEALRDLLLDKDDLHPEFRDHYLFDRARTLLNREDT